MDEVAMASGPRALGEALQKALHGDHVNVTVVEPTLIPEHDER
jgi:hypothetical protein